MTAQPPPPPSPGRDAPHGADRPRDGDGPAAEPRRGRPGRHAAAPGLPGDDGHRGLTSPTVVRFAPDGRVFVAEKSGLIKVFDEPHRHHADASSPTCAPRSTTTGIAACSGIALDPNFPAAPYVYVLYTYDASLGGTAPRVGRPAARRSVPDPPGRRPRDGCVVSGRLSRLTAAGNVMTGAEQVLIDDWCQQFPSHSVGTSPSAPTARSTSAAGDGASFTLRRLRPARHPAVNPCGDPPGRGGAMTPPDRRGRRAARAGPAHARRPGHGSTARSCASIPTTGDGRARATRSSAAPTPNAPRIIAYGLRNPFRIDVPPGHERALGRRRRLGRRGRRSTASPTPSDAVVENFGWPCYEGVARQPGYDVAGPRHLREPLRRAGRRHDPVLRRTATHDHGRARRDRARPAAPRSPGSPSTQAAVLSRPPTTARSSSPTTRATASG